MNVYSNIFPNSLHIVILKHLSSRSERDFEFNLKKKKQYRKQKKTSFDNPALRLIIHLIARMQEIYIVQGPNK